MTDLVFLGVLRRFEDAALLVLRLGVGGFLVWGVWDNITSVERMLEFCAFLEKFGFPLPQVLAPLSVWVQFSCGLAFIAGLFTRWAGLLCAANFIVAVVMVDRFSGVRGAFPAGVLVLIGLYLAARGAGRFALDRTFEPRT